MLRSNSIQSRGIRGISPKEEKGGYGGKDFQKKQGFKPEMKELGGDGWWEWWDDGTDGRSAIQVRIGEIRETVS